MQAKTPNPSPEVCYESHATDPSHDLLDYLKGILKSVNTKVGEFVGLRMYVCLKSRLNHNSCLNCHLKTFIV